MAVNGVVLARVRASLKAADLAVVREDLERPWGGFLVISNAGVREFIDVYFPNTAFDFSSEPTVLSPKILIVAPGRRLSWQYHLRRSEIWRIIEGPVAISRGPGDDEPDARSYEAGDQLRFGLGERHRLAGVDGGVSSPRSGSTPTRVPIGRARHRALTDDHDRT